MDYLTLKFGWLKSWRLTDQRTPALAKELVNLAASYRRKFIYPTQKERMILCKIIDAAKIKKVFLDWDGIYVSKSEAKKYILNYGKK